jgi:hypothetical protein
MGDKMGCQVLWSFQNNLGIEHLRLMRLSDSIVAESIVVGVVNNKAFRAQYKIRCDLSWSIREIDIGSLDNESKPLQLRADGKAHWRTATGTALHPLDGCIDVDISVTPFTNTLPIRRLNLSHNQSAEISVTYIVVPELEVKPIKQRYTCLNRSPDGGLYRYENLTSRYQADLIVDEDGLVIDYPNVWRRVWFE